MLILIFNFIFSSVELWTELEEYNTLINTEREDFSTSEILDQILNEEMPMEIETISEFINEINTNEDHFDTKVNKEEYCFHCLEEARSFAANLSKGEIKDKVQVPNTSTFPLQTELRQKSDFELIYDILSKDAHTLSLSRLLEDLKGINTDFNTNQAILHYITWLTNRLSNSFILPEIENTQNMTELEKFQFIVKYFIKNGCKFKFLAEWDNSYRDKDFRKKIDKIYHKLKWNEDKYKIPKITNRLIYTSSMYFHRRKSDYSHIDFILITNYAYEIIRQLPKDKKSFLISNIFFLIISSEKSDKEKIKRVSRLLTILRIYFYNPIVLNDNQTEILISVLSSICQLEHIEEQAFLYKIRKFSNTENTLDGTLKQIYDLQIGAYGEKTEILNKLKTLMPTLLILSGIW